jgi:DNA-directed RNA polymerase specialized sigma24 family protein
MAEGGTPADFEHWVEPHLTTLARFAARRVGPAERDDVVRRSLIRAWQRWSTYDASRATPVAWLLGIVANQPPRDQARQPARDVVELVDGAGAPPQTRDVDLERAVEGLGRRERLVVDLYHFTGLGLATVAEVVHSAPATVEATLTQTGHRLAWLLGDDEDGMDRRLSLAAARWQAQQPPPPEVPLNRLDESLRRHVPWRRALVSTAATLVVAGGAAALVSGLGRGGDDPPAQVAATPTPSADRARQIVPFRALKPTHPALGREENGVSVTPYDDLSATGDISGTVHPGDTLEFEVGLEAPGLVSLLPCPDYTITVGTVSTTRQLNCAEVPYFASLVRPSGKVTGFRPVLPAGTQVLFRMHVTVPDQPGRQQVQWALDGPHAMPGVSGVVDVTPR